jgi:co-chaperonin GroES (HSP10)
MVVPAGHRVLVRIEKAEEVTSGGIIVPKSIADRNTEAGIFGEVLAVGDTAWKDFGGRSWACVGDRVAVSKYSGFNIEDPDTNEVLRLCNDEDILAVIK